MIKTLKIIWIGILLCQSLLVLAESKFVGFPGAVRFEGVGPIYGVGAGVVNLAEKDRLHIIAGVSQGSAEGYGIGVLKIPFFWQPLSLNLGYGVVDKISYQTSYTRGFGADRAYVQFLEAQGGGLSFDYSSPKSRVQLSLALLSSEIQITGFEGLDGNEIDLPGGQFFAIKATHIAPSLSLNFVDDLQVPSRGIKFKSSALTNQGRPGQSDQLILNQALRIYFPMSRSLTIAIGARLSDASVLQEKPQYKTREQIEDAFAIDCNGLSEQNNAQCETLKEDLVGFVEKGNNKGTANPIGGNSSLRAFREGRFKAAHTRAASIELRWSLSKLIPLPGFNPKEKSGIELTPFYDWGFADDDSDRVYKKAAKSYGMSLRILFKGVPLRLGWAESLESKAWYATIGYP